MCLSVPFTSVPSGSFLSPFPFLRLASFYSHFLSSPIPIPATPSPILLLLSHRTVPLTLFIDSIKQIRLTEKIPAVNFQDRVPRTSATETSIGL